MIAKRVEALDLEKFVAALNYARGIEKSKLTL